MINTIDQTELEGLDLNSLVQRMDDILLHVDRERYGNGHDSFPVPLVSEIINTQKVMSKSDEEKRRIAHITFSYLVELEMNSVAGGLANAILFTPEYDETQSWMSPLFRLREGAIRQYQIVSSRIAMEIFMDILHYVETGHRLDSKRSKLKRFRKWLCDPTNQFHYFAHVLLEAYRFDRNIRTSEVHGTPKLPRKLLVLQPPSHQELNEPHKLINALTGCWRPLLDLLNEQKPSYMHITENEREWFRAYMSGSEDDIVDKLTKMFSGIE